MKTKPRSSDLPRRVPNRNRSELKSDLLFTIAGLSEQCQSISTSSSISEQPEIVRPQDHIFLLHPPLRNHRTRLCVLKWLTTHWDYIKRLTGDKSVEDYPRYASLLIRTPEVSELFYDFFDPLMNDPILKRTLKMARTDIDCRLQTIVTDSSAVHEKTRQPNKRRIIYASSAYSHQTLSKYYHRRRLAEKDGKYLLIQEAQAKCRGKWLLEAGHLDPGETIFEGAKREIREECGRDVELTGICFLHHLPERNFSASIS